MIVCSIYHRTSPYLTVPHRTSPYLTVPHRTSPYLTVPHRTSPYLTVPHRTSPYLTVPHRTSPYLTVPHRTSPYLTVPHRTSPNLTVTLLDMSILKLGLGRLRCRLPNVRYFTPTPEHEALRDNLEKLIEKEINPYCDQWEKDHMYPAHKVFKLLGEI